MPENPTNADLARLAKLSFEAAQRTHDCLEQHRKAVEAGNIVLSSQIKSNADVTSKLLKVTEANCASIKTVAGSVRAISKSVKAIDGKSDAAKNKSEEAASLAANANKKLDALNRTAWTFVLGVLTIVLATAIIGVGALAYQATVNHTSTVQAVDTATNTIIKAKP